MTLSRVIRGIVFGPVLVSLIMISKTSADHSVDSELDLSPPLGEQGTVAFRLVLDSPWLNGFAGEAQETELFSMDDLCRVRLRNDTRSVELLWQWQSDFNSRLENQADFSFQIPELPAHEPLDFIFSWDASQGYFDGYLNGYPLRLPGVRFAPWQLNPCTRISFFRGPCRIENFQVWNSYLNEDGLPVDSNESGIAPIAPPDPNALALDGELMSHRGKLLYDGSQIDPDFGRWIKEGPVVTHANDGWTEFESGQKANNITSGHLVWWYPEPLPESFVAEWDVRILSEYGLCIVFFAATGENDESIFAPSLAARDGDFMQYIRGEIRSYHISYYANTPFNPGRSQANLRKNNSFFLLAQGQAVIQPDSEQTYHVRLIKNKQRILMTIDDRPIIAFTDNKIQRYGAAYGSGYFGLRQMRWTRAEYRNLRIWAWDE
ncbi:MAG: DUF1961 family protein [Verrucomicrobiota bacterium JB024]|nr:DUF1961 family protein [Verrucomicrobiota bacterium JB024]